MSDHLHLKDLHLKDLHLKEAMQAQLTQRRRLRTVAVIETIKGVLVMMVATGLLSLAPGTIQRAGQALLAKFDWLPDLGLPELIDRLSAGFDSHRLAFAILVAIYILIRFFEAYGLWWQREWARWLGLIGVSVYIPFELYALFVDPGWGPASILAFNLLIFWLLWPPKKNAPLPKT